MLRESASSPTLAEVEPSPSPASARPAWIQPPQGHPYFRTDAGETWTPIGQNDAITWPELAGLFRRRDLAAVERHLRALKAQGVTCLRLMLEYCQGEHRYLEGPVGRFKPAMVRLWDDLFAICERVGMHILLTPYDTFFTWIRWNRHPYNIRNGGPCADRSQLLACAATRTAVKARLEFATRRWGASPALFAWDIWNEIHPAHAADQVAPLRDFVEEVAPWLKRLEEQLHGRRHPVTLSVFGPQLLNAPDLNALIFRHPDLDFANTHLYEHGTIDSPRNTVAPAVAAGRLIAAAISETSDQRPVFDSEHGPIHSFKDRKIVLSEPFDDEYFRHIQWAHIASGGAGGGMRWPNRHPHVLTPGMRNAQAALSRFLPLIDWSRLDRRCLNDAVGVLAKGVAAFGCGDRDQAIVWLLRTDVTGRDGLLKQDAKPRSVMLRCPAADGMHSIRFFDTRHGLVLRQTEAQAINGSLIIPVKGLANDVAIAVRRLP